MRVKGERTNEHGIKSPKGEISFRDNYKEKPSKETFMFKKKTLLKLGSTCAIN